MEQIKLEGMMHRRQLPVKKNLDFRTSFGILKEHKQRINEETFHLYIIQIKGVCKYTQQFSFFIPNERPNISFQINIPFSLSNFHANNFNEIQNRPKILSPMKAVEESTMTCVEV